MTYLVVRSTAHPRAKFRRTTEQETRGPKNLKDRALLLGPFLFGRWRYRRARDLRVSGTLIRLRRLYRDAIPGSITRLEAGSPTAGYHPREIRLSTLANVASVVALFLGTAVGVSAVYFARSPGARRISVRFQIKLWIRSSTRLNEHRFDFVDAERELLVGDDERRSELENVACMT